MKQQLTNSNPPSHGSKPTHDQIAVAAYHLYVENGCQAGSDLDDWLRAENILTQRMAETEKPEVARARLEEPTKVRSVASQEQPFARDERGSASREEIRQKSTPFRPASRQPQWRTSRAAQSKQVAA